MNPVIVPWLAEIGIITWRDLAPKKEGALPKHIPLPSELLATFAAFGMFSLIAPSQPRVAALLSWGVVVATFLNFVDPTLAKPNTENVPAPLTIKGQDISKLPLHESPSIFGS